MIIYDDLRCDKQTVGRVMLWFRCSYLDQKYGQEVEVSNSSKLLKQIFGDEVPGGILGDKATAELSSHKNRRGNRAHYLPVPLAREMAADTLTNTCKEKCVIPKSTATKAITWLSKDKNRSVMNNVMVL